MFFLGFLLGFEHQVIVGHFPPLVRCQPLFSFSMFFVNGKAANCWDSLRWWRLRCFRPDTSRRTVTALRARTFARA